MEIHMLGMTYKEITKSLDINGKIFKRVCKFLRVRRRNKSLLIHEIKRVKEKETFLRVEKALPILRALSNEPTTKALKDPNKLFWTV